jgi:hypothetical protein
MDKNDAFLSLLLDMGNEGRLTSLVFSSTYKIYDLKPTGISMGDLVHLSR